ncbi:hypothetical protein FB381_4742 [Nocardioides albertanoniae]|uniref:Uncharacterized protein n=1 Tax=Nocardioides albertanoniae TaxID=1175486 RepID=A0A543AE29_9ACTN|nr:hypothetical protein [Nocardioides albertanoniae]TQL70800.1 hypothetical protein FB381_4742 [Nocardioides albertanoniae]
MFSFVRAGAVVAGIALAGLATAPAFATGDHGHGDPKGNNGTVKIIKHGNIDDIPDNEPHVGCQLDVEWYGFDEGQDVISKINFELHAPTLTGELTVDGPSEVYVGEDAASGAGNDLDARQTYTLSSTGLAHPKQGFHVKVTVETPHSKGNETKSKVLWFQNCETEEPTEEPTPTPSESTPAEEPSEEPSETPTEATPVADEPAEETSSAAPVAEDDSAVPTNIDAGLAGENDSPVPAMWPLLAMLAGAAAAGTALVVVLRRRAAALVRND